MRHTSLRCGMRIITLFIFFMLLTACGSKPESTRQPITFRLKWLFNISVIGDLYAEVHGFFREKGLDVIIREGGPELDAIRELELGQAHFGVASADQVIRALAKGAPVVVVAQLFQVNPLQWMYRPVETLLRQPEELKGKTIGITYGGNDETIMRALLANLGINEQEVELFSVRYDYTPFYQRKVDLWPVYRNAEGVILKEKLAEAGESVHFFSPHEQGIHFVANSVVTTESLLVQQPEMVEKFVTALMQGWTAALKPENRGKALTTLRQFDRDTSEQLLKQQLQITRELIQPTPDFTIGQIDVQAWKQTEAIMLALDLIPSPVRIENHLKPIPTP
jgi:NitT/TauT family transport system substrate-binding protein